jgi:dodecin
MEAARTTEVLITATSPNSIEDAVNEAVARAAATLRGVQDVQVREQRVLYEGGSIVGYQVALVATFALEDDGESPGDLGVVLEPSEYRRLREAEEELEDLRAYEEAIMELRTGEDQLTPWQEARPRIEAERNALRRRGQL